MRRASLTVFLAMLLITLLTPLGRTDDRAGGLALVKVDGPAEAAFVANNFDETHRPVTGHVEVYLWPGDAADLEAFGYDFDITIPNLAAHDAAVAAAAARSDVSVNMPGPDRTDYRRLADYNAEMEELAKKHPKLVAHFTLPLKTLEGRDVHGVEIAHNVKADDGRPTFYVDGVHHAREWPAGEYPMIFAHYLVEGFGKNPQITSLLKKLRVVIVPIVNVDGFHYSREFLLGATAATDPAQEIPCGVGHCGAYWRKNRRSYTGLTAPVVQQNPDAYGIDPNRNYSYQWGGVGSTGTPLPIFDQTYRGEAPFSEPEIENVRRKLLADNVTAVVSHHTSGRLVLRPWADTPEPSPDERYLSSFGSKLAKALGGYLNGPWYSALYPSTGVLSDWTYGTFGITSYTWEHGRAFHPPYAGCEVDCVGTNWPRVMKAHMLTAEAALDPTRHGIVAGELVDAARRPARAKLRITRRVSNPLAPGNPLAQETWVERIDTILNAEGRFEWHLPPSTQPHRVAKGEKDRYKLTITAPGFRRTFTFVLDMGDVLDLGTIRI